MNDSELLARFARDGSAEAFRELVASHTNFVYSCAMQRLHDAHAAQDVTQSVFVALALKAKDLRPDTPLPGWLYKATRFTCSMYQRGERRRKEREMHAAAEQNTAPESNAGLWQELQPHLAAALDALSDKDREAVFTRFYRQGSYRDVATVLRTTEDSARKRVDRALEKLRGFFTKKGVVLSAAGLAGWLGANAVQAAPSGLAATASAAALTGTATSTLLLAKGALHAMFIAKLKAAALITATGAVLAGTSVVIAQKVVTGTNPSNAVVQPQQLLVDGQKQLRDQNFAVAIELLSQALANTQNEGVVAEALFWLGEAHQRAGNGLEAVRCWRQLLEKFPASRWAKQSHGRLEQVAGAIARGATAPAEDASAQDVLARWMAAIAANDLADYRQCLHSEARKVNEYGTAEAMKFWTKQINDLRKDGFKGEWRIVRPAEVTERFPASAVQAFPVVKGQPSREFILLVPENGAWVILRLFS